MSASSKKKLRREQEAAKLTEKQLTAQREAKKTRLYTVAFVAVMAVLLVVAIVVGVNQTITANGIREKKTVALTVGDHQINNVEMNYFYMDAVNNFYSQYGSYASLFGAFSMPDLRNTKMIMSWGSNGVINAYPMGRAVLGMKAQGGKLVVIDPRRTHLADKYADLYLQPKIGSDAAIAHAMAKIMIEEGRYDKAFVDKYCYGFEKYADYVKQFTLAKAEDISSVPAADIRKALDMFLETDPSTILPGSRPALSAQSNSGGFEPAL